jgi:transglutaminase-like putative cysteine protease
MSRARSSLSHLFLMAGLTALAGWVTLLSWRGLTEDASQVLVPLFMAAAVIAGGGVAGRWLRVPSVLVVTGQVLFAGLFVLLTVTGSPALTVENFGALADAIRAAMESSRTYVAPVPTNVPSVHPLLLIGGVGTLLVLDLTACTLQRVSIAGLALLSAYSLPVTLAARGVSWWLFVAMSGLFMAMLFVQHNEQLNRWGRGLGQSDDEADPTGFGVRTGAVRGSALAIGGTATTLALILPVLVPTLDLSLLDGRGPGQREIKVKDPMVDLRRDLQRGEDIPLLFVTTPDRKPSYLRLSVLNRYSDGSWSPGDRDIPDSQVALGEMPALDGVAISVPRKEYSYRVRVSNDFESTWLPTTEHISDIRASSDWRYDRTTMDFISLKDDVTTAGMSYNFTGVELELDETSMDNAVSGGSAVRSIFTEVPGTLPSEVRSLAAAVTGGADTRFRKARALQQWFRETGGFRYDVSQVASVGDGGADLLAFLDESTGRVGYCEQFAAAMAVMARTLGIPARVAVGFLEPRAVGINTWEFSAWDLHAWPELYFPGSGWVRFEPTPADRAPDVPAYSEGDIAPVNPTLSPSSGQASEELPSRGATTTPPDEAAGGGGSRVPWAALLGGLGGVVLVAGLLLLPRLVRRTRRERRLAGGIEDIWDELHDVAVDLGHRWPTGRSPRATGLWLGHRFGAPGAASDRTDRPRQGRELAPEGAQALDRLVFRLERTRYAPSPSAPDPEATHADLAAVERALLDGVSPRTERKADWWPRSVLRPQRERAVEVATRAVPSGQGSTMVDHAG